MENLERFTLLNKLNRSISNYTLAGLGEGIYRISEQNSQKTQEQDSSFI